MMKYTLSFILICWIFLIACCANRKQKINITLDVDTSAVVSKLPDRRSVPVEIIGKFDGWEIDSAACIANFDGASRFFVKGTGKENIAKQKMNVRTIEANTDSIRQEVWSYLVLPGIAKDKPFAFEVLYIPEAGVVVAYDTAHNMLKKDGKTDLILVSKQDLKLRMIKFFDTTMLTFPIATGRNPGDKKISGDKKTPEGIFTVYAIHDASDWDYDFQDGKGKIKGTYGKYFIRFKEHYHIGIHGTHLPETLGSRATDGCVRMHNENIEQIVPMVSRSKTLIAVTPAIEDIEN
jgi:lipoprotein-anchoring transpeptidase ErfK/SrfK